MPGPQYYESPISTDLTVTIADSATQSGAIDLRGHSLVGLFLPSTFDGTTVTFQTSLTLGGTYVDVQDGTGSAISKTSAASKYVPISPTDFAGVRYLKITAGTSQTGASIITLATRQV